MPVIVTDEPVTPEVGVKLCADSVGAKLGPPVDVPPPVVTVTGALPTPSGTTAVSCVFDVTVTFGLDSEPNFTSVAPQKPVPVTVIDLPVIADAGVSFVTVGLTGVT